jgi:hypothetical protein
MNLKDIDLKKIFNSRIFRGFSGALLLLIMVLLAFKLGTVVGSRKADFSCRWSDNYQRNFSGQRGFLPPVLNDQEFMSAHGLLGEIINILDSDQAQSRAVMVIKDQDQMEKLIAVDQSTIIKRFQDTIKPSELKVGGMVMVIGEPDDSGRISAKLIRVLPPLPPLPTAGDPRQ